MAEASSQVGLNAGSGDLPSPTLAFITFSNPSEAKAHGNRYLVRSHALRDFHSKKRQQWVLQKAGLSQQQHSTGVAAKTNKLPQHSPTFLLQDKCSCGDTHHGQCVLSHQWHRPSTQSTYPHQAWTPAPLGHLGAGRIDPFSTYPRPVSYHERLLIDYFITHYSSVNDATYPAAIAGPLTTIWVPHAVKDLAMLNGILLSAARDFADATRTNLQRLTLQLKGNLICSVNAAINNEGPAVRDETIAALLNLAFDEAATGDWQAFDYHDKALKLIVDARGGLNALGFKGFLRFLIQRIYLVCSFYRGGQSSFQSTLKPRNLASVEKLTPGFLAREIIWNISTDLLGILDDFCVLSELINSNPSSELPNQTIYHQYEAGLYPMSARGKETVSSPLFDEPDIQECICLAAEVYRGCIIYEQQHAYYAHCALSASDLAELKAGMSRIMQSANRHFYLELLFWMAFIGSLTATTATVNPHSHWVLMLAGIAQELRINTWEDARTVMKRFLWSDRKCERTGMDLWKLVELSWSGVSYI